MINKIKQQVIANMVSNDEGSMIHGDIIKIVKSYIDDNLKFKYDISTTSGFIISNVFSDKNVKGFIFGNSKISDGDYVELNIHMQVLDNSIIKIVRTKKGSKYLVI